MKNPKPTDPAATLVLPEDELAARRKADTDEPTAVLRTLTVQDVEQQLLSSDDDAPTAIQPILKKPAN